MRGGDNFGARRRSKRCTSLKLKKKSRRSRAERVARKDSSRSRPRIPRRSNTSVGFSLPLLPSHPERVANCCDAPTDVNSRPLSATHSTLHKLVNSLFEASTFAKHASAASAPSPPAARLRSSSHQQKQQQQQKRSLERHPVFALVLEVPARGVNVAFEQENGVTVEFEVGCLALGVLLPQAHAWG